MNTPEWLPSFTHLIVPRRGRLKRDTSEKIDAFVAKLGLCVEPYRDIASINLNGLPPQIADEVAAQIRTCFNVNITPTLLYARRRAVEEREKTYETGTREKSLGRMVTS